MTCAARFLAVIVLAVLAFATVPISAQSVLGKGNTGPVPDPVVLSNKGLFQAKFVSVGDDMFIAGQPTEKALRELRAKGVTTIVNLRMPEEMARVGFDEAALAKELGISTSTYRCAARRRIRTARKSSTRSQPPWRRPRARCFCTARSRGVRAICGRHT